MPHPADHRVTKCHSTREHTSTHDYFDECLAAGVATYVGEGAEGAEETDDHQDEDELLPSVREVPWVFIQHGRDDGLQTPELREHQQRHELKNCYTTKQEEISRQQKSRYREGSFVPCCPARG